MAKSSDSLCIKLIKTTKSAEVMAWLRSGNATLGIFGNADSIILAEEAYKLGAKQIIAVEIDEYSDDGLENTGRICVEMPTSSDARQRVVEWARKIANEQGFDGELDLNQRYLFLMLD